MNEKIIELQQEQNDKLNNIINQIENLNYIENIEKAYLQGYYDGAKIRNKMIGNMLKKMLIKHKDHLDFQLELKQFIEDLIE